MHQPNNIAFIANRENQDSQALLSAAVAAWRKAGLKVVGVLAENNSEEGMCSAGFLYDLASGKTFSIQLDTPPADTSCHLDTQGLDDASAHLLAQIAAADIVVLSKFGKREAQNEGLWPVFQAAIAANKPLLTTVSSKHDEAWNAYAPAAIRLAGDQEAIGQWWLVHKG